MRILIDLQAAQSLGSRNRGIGRYSLSLVQAMARQKGQHELLIALNGAFPDTIAPIIQALEGLVERRHIHVWNSIEPASSISADNGWRRKSAQLLRESFFASLHPDVTLVCSLFEGLSDDAVTSVNDFSDQPLTAVILYDLIPLIHREQYLENPLICDWYLEKIAYLRKASICLAISESSRQEAIGHLHFDDSQVITISSDVDPHFQRQPDIKALKEGIRAKYGLVRSFVMYTGGIDYRKNIERLIAAYAQQSRAIRHQHQLAIVCSVPESERVRLDRLIAKQGLGLDEVVLTGYVPDADLVSLYNLCTLFVFPSLHEGFGLPALEAMRCGAPVIASNTSSLPEVIGMEEALFDPSSVDDLARAMNKGLSDEGFRARLIAHGRIQSQQFSWDESAVRAMSAMEQLWVAKQRGKLIADQAIRPRLAYVSPLPPARSGIADYSAQLIPYLSQFYEIDVVVDQAEMIDQWVANHCQVKTIEEFKKTHDVYDRVLYHFGNSTFHQHMFDLLKLIPGVVVLHDFYLSGLLRHLELGHVVPNVWSQELYYSHGYGVLYECFHTTDSERVMWRYPCNGGVIEHSLGVIVHSIESARLARQWYPSLKSDWQVIPLMRALAGELDKDAARSDLGLDPDDFVVCSFGMLGSTKLNHRLLKAWLKSPLAQDPRCKLIFVGEAGSPNYYADLMDLVKAANVRSSIIFTQWLNSTAYQRYLEAANLAVQLRAQSRGETSAAVLDCMNFGVATIINAHGSMAEIEDNAVYKLADQFTDEDLIEALTILWQDQARRQEIASAGRQLLLRTHHPGVCARSYHQALEQFYYHRTNLVDPLIAGISSVAGDPSDGDLLRLAQAMDKNFPLTALNKQLLLDVTLFAGQEQLLRQHPKTQALLRALLLNPPKGYRVEPIYWGGNGVYLYARAFTLNLLECPKQILWDEPISYRVGDVLLDLGNPDAKLADQLTADEFLRAFGVNLSLAILEGDWFELEAMDGFFAKSLQELANRYDVFLCGSHEQALGLSDSIHFSNLAESKQLARPSIDWVALEKLSSLSEDLALNNFTNSADAGQHGSDEDQRERTFDDFLEQLQSRLFSRKN